MKPLEEASKAVRKYADEALKELNRQLLTAQSPKRIAKIKDRISKWEQSLVQYNEVIDGLEK